MQGAGVRRKVWILNLLNSERMRALRGRLHPALPVEGATQAPIIEAL
ncbi:MAG: hypothetical protein HZA13_03645 [Nitrospirae bacterium]|nr:hypothetical protein [Nitrospirota bacterium]